MDLKRLTHGLIYAALMACTMAGCSSEDAMGMDDGGSARWIRGLDGTLQLSTCTAPDISRPPPCGVVDGQPFYAFYDGCNWCQCVGESGPVCTLRACDPNEPAVFFFDFNLPGTPTQDETWACDEGGRLFRSACLPDSPTIPCSDVTFPPQLEWRDP
jgi:hypothetical protein